MNMVVSVPADFRRGPELSRAPRHVNFFQFSSLRVHASTASLNGLHLSLAEGQTAETSGELSTVEEFAVLGTNWTQGVTGLTTDAAVERGATERTVLLSLGAVGGEGVGESSSGRSGVYARSVVNGLCSSEN